MMANWNLDALDRDLPRLGVRTLLVVGSDDKAIAPDTAFAVRDRVRRCPCRADARPRPPRP